MPYDKDLHHRRSVRLKYHDYRQAGSYFVTACTRDRVTYFTEPSLMEIASAAWLAIPQHTVGVSLDTWVVMPNHVHGLLTLSGQPPNGNGGAGERPQVVGNVSSQMSQLAPQRHSLAAVVRSYKSAVARACHSAGRSTFAWQSGYYEHVVRTEAELARIRQYICDNPAQWALDHDNPEYRGRAPSSTPWND